MVKVKICGITNPDDAVTAYDCGADFLGFVFVKNTPRYIGDKRDFIFKIPEMIRTSIGLVGLFKDEPVKEASRITAYCGLKYVQLHGNESPEYCREFKNTLEEKHGSAAKIMKVFRVKDEVLPCGKNMPSDYTAAEYFMFDTYDPEVPGGSGKSFRWDVLKGNNAVNKPFFIAGGLTPANVAGAIEAVRPFGVDVSSGVERSAGKKDRRLMKEFIDNAKKT